MPAARPERPAPMMMTSKWDWLEVGTRGGRGLGWLKGLEFRG